jgi:hypothetical protein
MNEARGVAIDRQVVAVPDYTRSDGTRDTIILDAVKPQQDLMKQPVAETEVEERVDSESCDRHVIVLLSYASSRSCNCRCCVMPIIRTGCVIYGLQTGTL